MGPSALRLRLLTPFALFGGAEAGAEVVFASAGVLPERVMERVTRRSLCGVFRAILAPPNG
jgi:hypothetical protein